MKEFKDFESNGGAVFCAIAHGNYLAVQKVYGPGRLDFEKRVVRVEPCSDFAYKLMKTKIKADGGAVGLLSWLERCEKATDFCGALRSQVYNYIFDNMRECVH
jgi:hypothetical protein